MCDTVHDTSVQRRSKIDALMNQRLADGVDLQMQMKQALWNVKNSSVTGLHELFGKAARSVETYVDRIAERIVQFGGSARGTVRAAAALSLLDEYPLAAADDPAHVSAVVNALSTFGQNARSTISEATQLNDTVSADLFTEFSHGIDQWLRFIEAQPQANKW